MKISLLKDMVNVGAVVTDIDHILTSNWSPFVFKNEYRLATNFVETSLLVYDIDKDLPISKIKDLIPASFKYYIAPTKSHQIQKGTQPPCDRYRLIIPLNDVITDPFFYKVLWNKFKSSYNIIVDEQCKDLARFYYPSTSIIPSEGRKLYRAERLVLQKPLAPSVPAVPVQQQQGTLSRATLKFLSLGVPHGEWHGAFIKAAMDMKEQGYTEEEASTLLAKASPVRVLDDVDLQQLQDVYLNRGGALSFRPQGKFPTMLPLKGKELLSKPDPKAKENYVYLLMELLKLDIKLNQLTERVEINGESLTDEKIIEISLKAWEEGLNRDKEMLLDLIINIANSNKYHPLKQFIESTPWDGKDRIKELFCTLDIVEEETPEALRLYKTYLHKFFIGMVRKIYGMPWRGHGCLVFVGGQAMGKSRWFEKIGQDLCPQGYITSRINVDDKDSLIRLSNKFLWVVEELDAVTSNKDAAIIKDFLEKPDVTVRLPYARTSKDFKTVTSFAAATNSASFLTDLSGNRRFWIIPIKSLVPNHEVDLQQVLAQAYSEREAEWYLNPEELRLANELNQRYINNSNLEALAMELIRPGEDRMTMNEILETLEFGSSRSMSRSQRSNLSGILVSKRIISKNHSGKVFFLVDGKFLTKRKNKSNSSSTTITNEDKLTNKAIQ